jgi:hypothetical protein
VARPLPCLLMLFALAAGAGCDSDAPAGAAHTEPPVPRAEAPAGFDPAACGTVTGVVTWTGPVPEVAPVQHITPRAAGGGYDIRMIDLPNAPRIDKFTRALAGAVVTLRGLDAAKARPWDHPPATVELRDLQIVVIQGERKGRSGFVRRGEKVEMKSADLVHHNLRGRGAAFFSLPFPDPEKPLTRAFDAPGRVDLSSAAGYYWQSAELFVCEHPYYVVTDAEGRFRLPQVPAGKYELVAWHPSHTVVRTDRNPESGLPSRLHFAAPFESARAVEVVAGRAVMANLTLPK